MFNFTTKKKPAPTKAATEKAMKLIENITDDEIRINIQRQANNAYDQMATAEAVSSLIAEGRAVSNMTTRSFAKMKSVIKKEEQIVNAMRDKIAHFKVLTEEYAAIHGDEASEYGVEEMLTEASAENANQ